MTSPSGVWSWMSDMNGIERDTHKVTVTVVQKKKLIGLIAQEAASPENPRLHVQTVSL